MMVAKSMTKNRSFLALMASLSTHAFIIILFVFLFFYDNDKGVLDIVKKSTKDKEEYLSIDVVKAILQQDSE